MRTVPDEASRRNYPTDEDYYAVVDHPKHPMLPPTPLSYAVIDGELGLYFTMGTVGIFAPEATPTLQLVPATVPVTLGCRVPDFLEAHLYTEVITPRFELLLQRRRMVRFAHPPKQRTEETTDAPNPGL